MKKGFTYLKICTLAVIASLVVYGFRPGDKEVHWISFDEAIKLNKEHPRKIFIDVYTQWCGWCKTMDKTTYKDQGVIDYLNTNFYCVHLDAETTDTFHLDKYIFVNEHPKEKGSVNTLASSLLDNKMMYPTTVYLDEKLNRLSIAPGYLKADELMVVLKFFVEEKYKTMTYEDYKKSLGITDDSNKPVNTN